MRISIQTAPLSIRNFSASRRGRILFQNLSFDLASGEVLGIFGSNGSGKTTLLECICGLRKPAIGELCVQGQELTSVNFKKRLAAGISFLPQHDAAIRNLSVAENFEIFGVDDGANLVGDLSLDTLLSRKIRSLSEGESRKVDFCLAALRRATVYIFDEPFSGVEPKSITKMIAHIADLQRLGCSILITDHTLQFLRANLTTCLLLRGEIYVVQPVSSFFTDEFVIDSYLGRNHEVWSD